jgi:hypothetical protein
MRIISLVFLVYAITALRAQDARLEQTKALCRENTAGFISPATDLADAHRIIGPKGIAALQSPEEIRLAA